MIEGVARGPRPEMGTGSQGPGTPGHRLPVGAKGEWV